MPLRLKISPNGYSTAQRLFPSVVFNGHSTSPNVGMKPQMNVKLIWFVVVRTKRQDQSPAEFYFLMPFIMILIF